jgi:flagellar biosynthesis protein FliQ
LTAIAAKSNLRASSKNTKKSAGTTTGLAAAAHAFGCVRLCAPKSNGNTLREDEMSPDLALQLMSDMLLASLLIGAPILLSSMLVGLAISILQVVTQIQEMSLTFVPKIVAVVVSIVVFGPWMLRKLMAYSSGVIVNIPSYF